MIVKDVKLGTITRATVLPCDGIVSSEQQGVLVCVL